MFQNRIQFPCIHTCDSMHEHGVGYAEMLWLKSDPLAVSVSALDKHGSPIQFKNPNHVHYFVVARDNLWTAVRSGRSYGCPVIGEGDVTCRVLPQSVITLAIRWGAGYSMLVDRDLVSNWIDESYTVIGKNAESDVINIDQILKRILESPSE
jgi:hypothetical protein